MPSCHGHRSSHSATACALPPPNAPSQAPPPPRPELTIPEPKPIGRYLAKLGEPTELAGPPY